ncbi:YaeQ family protein [Vibrio hannami]|uniref:YaeQ family protein n=1 Tax=Vibrio hannami TaxID=2717094 RepID=UPI00240FBC66|nr:YaeQ family protein [Vibrio hannami]MDG3085931.1 YaeQ family protein [Vibrio hannami]
MALKPTIFKFRISLSDINRDYYDSLALTVAQHPSENTSRMLVRVLSYCLNASPELMFTKGLSTVDEPDLWQKTLDDKINTWIEVGEPDSERVKKATRIADKVIIYSFNRKSDIWWQQNQTKLDFSKVSVYQFTSDDIQQLSTNISRTMELSVMISGSSLFISTPEGEHEIEVVTLKGK